MAAIKVPLLFRASDLGYISRGQRRFATGGQRHYDLGVATKIELRGKTRDVPSYFPAQREERGEETSQKRKQGKGLLCRRVPRPSGVGSREKLVGRPQTNPAKMPRRELFPNYFPAQRGGRGWVSSRGRQKKYGSCLRTRSRRASTT